MATAFRALVALSSAALALAANVDPSFVFARVSGDLPWSDLFATSSEIGLLLIVIFSCVFKSALGYIGAAWMRGETLPEMSCGLPPGKLGRVFLPVPFRLLVHVYHWDGHAPEGL